MIYELINPSDAVTVEADDDRIAIVATLLVGAGAYGLKRVDRGEEVAVSVPLLLLVPVAEQERTLEAFCERALGATLLGFVDRHRDEIACCLESAVLGKATDRAAIVAIADEVGGEDPALHARALERWNEQQRSSLNDICGRARVLARALRVKPASGPGDDRWEAP